MYALLALMALTTVGSAQDQSARDSAVHLLNRGAYGPRPGDVDRVSAIGAAAWIEAQLYPERIRDTVADRLTTRFTGPTRPPAELIRLFNDRNDSTSGFLSRRAVVELQQVTIVRAITSERQLYEVLVDFWTNHFNVFVGKGMARALTPDYVARAIRPNALGRFDDLLIATARHPAMLVYLDNALSVAEGARPPGARANAPRAPRGLNENYARELLELHTLGVDGGYTQTDVREVARILTGWSLNRTTGTFQFNTWAHDRAPKTVMQETFAQGGEAEGLALLRWLAMHPSTMHHVSARLCARFVADNPPAGCTDAGVLAWRETRGDLRAVVRAILLSPEFWAPEARASKHKTPLEFVVSAARALDATPDSTLTLAATLRGLGQPLFSYSPPTGYPERLDAWVSSSALFDRFNTAVALAGRAPGLEVSLDRLLPGPMSGPQLVDAVIDRILGGQVSPTTRVALTVEAEGLGFRQARTLLIGLALGSPEFQRQ